MMGNHTVAIITTKRMIHCVQILLAASLSRAHVQLRIRESVTIPNIFFVNTNIQVEVAMVGLVRVAENVLQSTGKLTDSCCVKSMR